MADKKRKLVCQKVYVDSDGKDLGRSASPDADELQFRFYADGDESGKPSGDVLHVRAADVPGFSADLSRTAICALWHGLAQKVGDRYADSSDPDATPFDVASAQWENIANGVWVEEGKGGGPRITMLFIAFARAMIKAGKLGDAKTEDDLSDEQKAALMAHLTDDDPKVAAEKKAKVAAVAQVEAELRALKIEREKAKLAEAKAKAKDGDSGLDAFSA